MLAELLVELIGEICGEFVTEAFFGSIYKSSRYFWRQVRYVNVLRARRMRLIHT